LRVTARIGEITIDCTDPWRVAQFWCAVLGYEVTPQQEAGAVIAGSPTLLFLKIPEAVRHEGATT